MKKFVALVATIVATLAMTTSVFAANSPAAVSSATAGVAVSTAVDAKFTSAVSTADGLKAILGNTYTATSQVMATVELTGAVPADGMVTLNVAGINQGDSVELIHWIGGDLSKPEVLKATTGNGTVTAKFTSFSPVAVVRTATVAAATPAATPAAPAATPAATSAGAATAPQTGDNGVVTAMIIALACVAGIAVVSKKKVLSK